MARRLLATLAVASAAPLNRQHDTLQPAPSSYASLLAQAVASCPHSHGCSRESFDSLEAEGLTQLILQWKNSSYVHSLTAVKDESTCFNGCFDHGSCEGGLCQCTRGKSFDCAKSKDKQLPRYKDEGFIYVYDMDPQEGLAHYVKDNGDGNYQAEALFVKRLMSDWSVRTLDPKKATLFYTPTYAYYKQNNVCFAPECVNLTVFTKAATHWAASPHAPHGEDHVYFFTGDKGTCGMPKGPIYITHWGLTKSWNCMGLESTTSCTSGSSSPPQREHKAVADAEADEDEADEDKPDEPPKRGLELAKERAGDTRTLECTDQRAIVAPPANQDLSECDLPVRERADEHERNNSWPYQLSFAGSVFRGQGEDAAASEWDGCGEDGGCYSQGVRQAVFKHWHDKDDFLISEQGQGNEVIFGDARFCLCPSGDGYGVRHFKAIAIAGCVPLIIQPSVRNAFDEMLPYKKFALLAELDDVPRLDEILKGVSAEQHKSMRKAMRRYAHAFSYNEEIGHGSGAYEHIVKLLRKRADELGRPSGDGVSEA